MGLFDDVLGASEAPQRPPIPDVGRALLKAIAPGESPSYNTIYGGGTFDDYSDHPRRAVPITSGPNVGKTSSAAGLYQFLGSTWDEVKKEAGLPDFSPGSQDAGAWHLANKTYKTKTGRDLETDLTNAKGNPNAIQGIGKMLAGTWTSLPGGIEPNRATGSFAQRFDGANRSTDVSSQSRKPIGLFDDVLVPQGQEAAASGSPPTPPDTGGRFTDTAGQNFRTAREGQPAAVGKFEAALHGIGRGATFNFSDELSGLNAAALEGLDIPKDARTSKVLSPIMGLARLGYEYMTGTPGEATAAYRATVSKEREAAENMRQQQPGASLAGELGGAVATVPFTGGASAATLPARIVQGAKVGGAYGALSGAGEGTDLASRATGAATGGVTGGLIGGAGVPVVEGLVKTGQGISRAAAPITKAFRGVADPEAEAALRVASARARDVKTGSAGLDDAQFAAEKAAGTPVVNADLGGTATRSLARSAVDTSPEARAALETVTSERYITQNPRIAQFVKETFDFPDVGAKLTQIQEAARRSNAPAYRKAYTEGAKGIWDDGLEQFSQAPVIQNAIRSAFLTARNRDAIAGHPPIQNPFTLNKTTGVYELKANADGSQALPNLQFWDHVKRNLDKVNSPEARAAAQALRDHLDDVVPSYKAARAGAASWFGAEDALDAGAKFATMGGLDAVKLAQARGAHAKMSEAEKKLFETGFVSNLLTKIESRKDGQDVVKAIFDSPFAKKQAELALGPERAALLEARLQTERVMNALKNEVSGNSNTARRLYELGMAGATNPYTLAGLAAGGSSYATGSVGPGDAFAAGLVFAARKGQIKIDERVAKRVGEMLASNDQGVVQKGLKIVARNENMKAALRAFDAPVARAGAGQAPVIPALQSGAVGRADQEQQ